MLDLGPTKLLVIFIVVVVLLGPDKLPQVARQLGNGWRRPPGASPCAAAGSPSASPAVSPRASQPS